VSLGPAPVELTPEEHKLLSEALSAYAGLMFRDDMKYLLERRLLPRLQALELADFGAYCRYLRHHPGGRAELATAAELLLTHETYFYREPEQLRAFSHEVLPLLMADKRASRRLRIWSAGCATGEEPYTLAMLLIDSGLAGSGSGLAGSGSGLAGSGSGLAGSGSGLAGGGAGLGEDWDATVYGSDLSRRVLAQARRGIYGANAMRATPADALARHFEVLGPGQFQVRDVVKKRVSFGQVNLLDAQNLAMVGRMDAIFCRNVMIYFDLPARRRLLRHFYEKLHEGGYLFLGHAENLINATADFELVHLQGDLVYRRPRS